MKIHRFGIFVIFLTNFVLLSQQSNDFSHDDLSNMIPGNYNFQQTRVSPNGERLAWIEPGEGMCLFTFTTQVVDCVGWGWNDDAWIRDNGNRLITIETISLQWSYDSRYIAMSKNFRTTFIYDSDIWIFDTHTDIFTNVTITCYYFSLYSSARYCPEWHRHRQNGSIFYTADRKQPVYGVCCYSFR